MREELDILKIVAENPSISQRKIAEQTGISLGQVNFLIKKCVKKGLIKIEGQTSKSIKYNLTPKGIAEKTARTLQYIKISYSAVIMLSDKIKSLSDKYEAEGYGIVICGDDDEIMGVIKIALGNVPIIKEPVDNKVIFYWNTAKLQQKKKDFKMTNCKFVNLLD